MVRTTEFCHGQVSWHLLDYDRPAKTGLTIHLFLHGAYHINDIHHECEHAECLSSQPLFADDACTQVYVPYVVTSDRSLVGGVQSNH